MKKKNSYFKYLKYYTKDKIPVNITATYYYFANESKNNHFRIKLRQPHGFNKQNK